MQLTPAAPQPDPSAADAGTLEEMGVIPEQPIADPEPPPPPVYDAGDTPD
ncbi:hypothetical protein [Streptomyces griseofuscus]|nr:hypothetical protein [Streptomyces griseofuscus]